MTRFAYVNGKYLPFHHASIHIEDRGYQFADGIYEVISVIHGKLVDADLHLDRMDRSLKEIEVKCPLSRKSLKSTIDELLEMNRHKNAMVYIQVTRGVAPRAFPYPKIPVPPSIVITVRPYQQLKLLETHKNGVKIITVSDERWARPDIKTLNLLASVRAKEAANRKGAFEAVFEKNGFLTEGSSSNFWCVFGNTVKTYPKSHDILTGITRERIRLLAKDLNITIQETPFSLKQAHAADEAFLSSANVLGMPVTTINEKIIGTGKPGPITLALQQAYLSFVNSNI